LRLKQAIHLWAKLYIIGAKDFKPTSLGGASISLISDCIPFSDHLRPRTAALFHPGCSKVSLYICSPRHPSRLSSRGRESTRILFSVVCHRRPFASRDEPLTDRSTLGSHGAETASERTADTRARMQKMTRRGRSLRRIRERDRRRKSEAVSVSENLQFPAPTPLFLAPSAPSTD